jgi:hypothetical protein
MERKEKKARVAADKSERRVRRTNLDLAIEALSRRVNKLETALDTNSQIFSDTMKVMEIKVNVLEEVISHLHRDGAGLVEAKDGRVDFGYYMQMYIARLEQREEAAAAPEPTPVIVSPDDETPTIFGGDVA